MSEGGRGDPGLASPQPSGIKVLETLKKHVFEHGEAPRYVMCVCDHDSSWPPHTARP